MGSRLVHPAVRPRIRVRFFAVCVLLTFLVAGCLKPEAAPSQDAVPEPTTPPLAEASPEPIQTSVYEKTDDARSIKNELPSEPLVAPYPVLTRLEERLAVDVVQPSVHGDWEPVGPGWDLETPHTLFQLSGSMTWTHGVSNFGIRLVPPAGDPLVYGQVNMQNAAQTVSPLHTPSGPYRFDLMANGVVVPDQVVFVVDYDVTDPDWIKTGPAEGGWVARAVYRDGLEVGKNVTLDLNSGRGDIKSTLRAKTAYVEAWVSDTAAEEWLAMEGLKNVRASVTADPENATIKQTGSPTTNTARADVRVRMPPSTLVKGKMVANEGDIRLDGLLVGEGLKLEANKGMVEANVSVGGDVSVTAGKDVLLRLRPVDSGEIAVQAPGQSVVIHVAEAKDVGLDLQVVGEKPTTDIPDTFFVEEEGKTYLRTKDAAQRIFHIKGKVDAGTGSVQFLQWKTG